MHPAQRSAMVFPLVVLVAVLPGMAALNSWDFTPPGPMWGLRGLAVLDGLVLDQVQPLPASSPFGSSAFRAELLSRRSTLGWKQSRSGSAQTAIRLEASCRVTSQASLPSSWSTYTAGSGEGLDWVYRQQSWWVSITACYRGYRRPRQPPWGYAEYWQLCWRMDSMSVLPSNPGGLAWAGPILWAIVGGLSLGIALLQ